ncbi:NADH:flavin oxidoreductase 1 [Punctularia strigosozonata HHB-11173 SS5]|uniref:NADH:flavin oxidoreductase 1 n=1 Tax=Punctularia strigosozonata (strain HHB-11173) TaxID=741275 RepID=UPI0004416347|nr:NADH:flavin oxidoreductase 1 [Punctularia strigosozonata HHB-11173 SS5]EIN13984.1 NADH:flavin oxidoreductase 1 [Punctularia strigosozonata HHB-11173 SS5]
MANVNKPVPGADQYYPLNEPPIGTAYDGALPPLFKPLTIREVKFSNRIWVSPMCQYSSDNGHATDWHLVHIGGFATRGWGAICMEATSVVPEGRISPQDAGLWTDSQIPPLNRIVNFAHAQGTKIGVQLAHAGRKASTLAPWIRPTNGPKTYVAHSGEEGGWPDEVYGPSAISFADTFPSPKELSVDGLNAVTEAFLAAIERCKTIGFDFIEIHGAHGYLLHEFLSPLSNARSDDYGGQTYENRVRYPLQLIEKCRKVWDKPLFVRISATDWAQGPEQENGEWKQWGIEQSKLFTKELERLGVDLVDCSTGGNWAKQEITVGPGYQVPYAEALKGSSPTLSIGTVGMITTPKQANEIIQDAKADVVFLAREAMRDPHFPMRAAAELGVAIKPANQYERAWVPMLLPRH